MDNIMTMEQGSPEWFEQRLGRLTASSFGCLMTMPRSKKDREAGLISKTTESYLIKKVSEVLTGTSKELKTEALEWGSVTEDEARKMYELENIVKVEQIGFATLKSNSIVGGSPDGLVDAKGMIEIKCPDSDTFTAYLFNQPIPKGYMIQMQGNMWILDRDWCDFIVYDPRIKKEELRMFIKRVYRDEAQIALIASAVDRSLRYYKVMLERLGLSFDDILNVKYQA